MDHLNEVIHPVTEQWHSPVMVKHGYVAETLEATGLVRRYVYVHPLTSCRIICCTGVHSDYWQDDESGITGLWATLDNHLTLLEKPNDQPSIP